MTRSRVCRSIIELLFPSGPCILCGRDSREGPAPGICRACWRTRKRIEAPRCPICGVPYSGEMKEESPGPCGACLKDPPAFVAHAGVYSYEGPVRRLILLFKDEKRYPLSRPLGRAVAGEVLRRWPGVSFDAVVPVPSPYSRMVRRGFSPAELIARHTAMRLGIPCLGLLRVGKAPSPQKGLSAAERRKNVRGAFTANADKTRDRKLLLVDDVTTTGSTLREAAQALSRAGARVHAATVAMALKRNLDLG